MKEKFNIRFFTIIFIAWAVDMISKYLSVKYLSGGNYVEVFGDLLRFQLLYNTGGVFGILQGSTLVFHILSGLAITFLVVYYYKTNLLGPTYNAAIALVLGGALGNFTDRFFYKGVVDFIDMGIGSNRWPTYNIADAFISIGALLLLLSFYQEEKKAKAEQT